MQAVQGSKDLFTWKVCMMEHSIFMSSLLQLLTDSPCFVFCLPTFVLTRLSLRQGRTLRLIGSRKVPKVLKDNESGEVLWALEGNTKFR